jgi:hypothetical protein
MLFLGLKEDDIAWFHLLDWSAIALHTTKTLGDDDGLSSGVSVPASARSRLKSYYASAGMAASISRKEGVDANVSSKPVLRSNHGWSGA